MTGILDGKVVAVFAATGAIGSAVARAALREGATVYASGHRSDAVTALAGEFPAASWHEVDANDTEAVRSHLDAVIDRSGRLDAVFNGIGARPQELGYPQPAESMGVEEFLLPFRHTVASTYITSSEAALRMADCGGGSVVTLSATLSVMAAARMANLSAACAAIEGLTRSLAGEFGHAGVRVNCVRASAMPATRTIRETSAAQSALSGEAPAFSPPPLGRPITVDDTADTAVFLMSDLASATTGQVLTVCAGQFV